MVKKKFPMTKEGFQNLKQELFFLETVKRKEVNERIKKARSFCDFREDSEYDAAIKELATVENRIAELGYMIQEAQIIEKSEGSTVEFGKTITINYVQDGTNETYTIVDPSEADPFEAKISYLSPIAKSLLGSKINDKVTVQTPDGKVKVKIISIE